VPKYSQSWEEDLYDVSQMQLRIEEGGLWGSNPPPEIPKAHQNRAKLNPIVKTVKNCLI